jgi:pimeloyl-ACP methyl ester carboxylesterase
VDADRVATFGSSMGGGNALAAAAGDKRVAAAISQVPFLDIWRQAHRSSPRVSAQMLLAAVRGGYLPAVGQPQEAAFINAPGSEVGWRHVVETGEDSRWRNRVSARWLLGRPFRPARLASRLRCPWLVCVGEADRVARPVRRSPPHTGLRWGSCGPTREWTTSTSTTAPSTTRSSPTNWTSFAATCSGIG